MLTSAFPEALERFKAFLAGEGLSGRITWVWPEDVVVIGRRLFFHAGSTESRAEAAYAEAAACGGHARFNAIGVAARGGLVASIRLAWSEEEAADHWARDLTLSASRPPYRAISIRPRLLLVPLRLLYPREQGHIPFILGLEGSREHLEGAG